MKHKIVREVRKTKGREGLEKDIGRDKIRRIRKLKDGKAAAIDEIPCEA